MNQREDVVVVGAGVVGLASALALIEAGRGVRVLDAGRVGGGSSHGNCGTITPSHAPPLAAPGMVATALRMMLTPDAPLYVRPRMDPVLWRWLWTFAARCNARDWKASALAKSMLLNDSRARLQEWVDRYGLDCDFRETGEDYIYPSELFLPIRLPAAVLRRLGGARPRQRGTSAACRDGTHRQPGGGQAPASRLNVGFQLRIDSAHAGAGKIAAGVEQHHDPASRCGRGESAEQGEVRNREPPARGHYLHQRRERRLSHELLDMAHVVLVAQISRIIPLRSAPVPVLGSTFAA